MAGRLKNTSCSTSSDDVLLLFVVVALLLVCCCSVVALLCECVSVCVHAPTSHFAKFKQGSSKIQMQCV